MRSWFIRFAGSVALVLTATACLDPENGCTPSSCPEETACDEETLACVYRCEPACAAHQYCTTSGTCAQRYESVTLVKPGQNAFVAKSAAVEAKLNLAGAVTQYTQGGTVRFNATHPDGQDAGSGLLTAAQNGTFTGTWSVPGETGSFRIAATHLESGLVSATHDVTLDTKPPAFELVSTPPNRDGGVPGQRASEIDTSLVGAWKRDEVATIYVRADEAIQENSAQLTLWSVSNDGGVANLPPQTYTLAPASGAPCNGKPYCGSVTVDLADIAIPVFRGQLHMAASGIDIAGNQGAADAGLPVTRLKWSLQLDPAESHKASPAIGQDGVLYLGTAHNVDPSVGRTVAVGSTGRVLWTIDGGSVVASPSIGRADGGSDRIYVASKSGTGTRVSVLRPDGGESFSCSFSTASVEAGLALGLTRLDGESQSTESAYAIINGASGSAPAVTRPDFTAIDCIRGIAADGATTSSASAVVVNDTVLYGDDSGQFRGYAVQGTGTVASRFSNPTKIRGRGAAVSGTTVVYGGPGVSSSPAAFGGIATDGGTAWRADSQPSDLGGVALNAAGEVYVGRSADPAVVLTPSGTTAQSRVIPASGVLATPILGENGEVYFVSQNGIVSAWIGDLRAWSTSTSAVSTSPALDCARNATGVVQSGRPGVLYVLTTGGTLHAISVDSRGIDTTAKWPKWQHDPRNTGNPATDLSEFSCE